MDFDPLRHLLAAIAYRFHAAVVDAPASFADFDPGHGVRSPRALLTHCVQVLRLARSSFEPGLEVDAAVREGWAWAELVEAFHAELGRLDAHHAEAAPAHEWPVEKLVQGPYADVLTHVGQLTLLRRLEGHPVERQSYLRARVEVGRLGPDQAAPAPPLF
ncbi:MAG TPA: hypothetical protein VKA86_11585 [Candidatus Krumholzibacteria bacterium]|nr:hypothetical protein [Candidatus Krumholzibacteria bacterium]